MKKTIKRVFPAVLAMSVVMAPIMTQAAEFVPRPGKPYDDETQRRLEDNVMEYEEVGRLIDVYNTTLKNLRVTYDDTKDSLSDIDELKEQIEDGSDQIAEAADMLGTNAETF